MSINPSACGPIAIPTIRNATISGILVRLAKWLVRVPTAKISAQERSMCFAISIAIIESRGFGRRPRLNRPPLFRQLSIDSQETAGSR
jgi:hypothetical protein